MGKPASPERMLARAERLVAAGLADRRRRFDADASAVISTFARKGTYGGSSHKQHMHAVCVEELHLRTAAITRRLLRSHKSISAPPSNEYRQAAKDWIAVQVADEAKNLKRHMWKPRAAIGERGEPDGLDAETRLEVESVYAVIDQKFDDMQHDRIERALRWATRTMPPLGRAVRAMLSR
jgi:hypothetical protein